MSDIMRDIVAVLMAVIGLAMLAVVIKSNNTSQILSSGLGGFGSLLKSASGG